MAVSPSKSKVCFFFETRKLIPGSQGKLKFFIERLFKKEGKKLKSLNYIFTTDARLLKINQDFLNHDSYTDIVSFDLSETGEVEGEIYISVDRVLDNADTLIIPPKRELLRVMFHGALHLCGYQDNSKFHVKQMREKEDHYLKLYQLDLKSR